MRHHSYEMGSLSIGNSFFASEMASHVTVLKPRELGYTPSDIESTFRSFPLEERETWFHRMKLGFRILAFCMGPANIWRFPEQSFIHGNASYIYLYFLYIGLFCTPLLVFELSLSQYILKGFAKILTSMCPIMEGVTLSMVLYCIMANLVYSVIMTYSLTYSFTAWIERMPHSYCSERLEEYGCQEKTPNISLTPECIYLGVVVERYVDSHRGDFYNWKNAYMLALIYTVLCVCIIVGVFKYHWVPIIMSCFIFVTFFYVAVVSAFMEGALQGLSRMFIPNTADLKKLKTWVYPFEQSIATIGVGTGPLTTIWSISKIQYWSRFDCIIINLVAVFCTLFAGVITYSAAGVAAHVNNHTFVNLINLSKKELDTFVIVTKLFNTMPSGLSHFTLFVYYMALFCSCFYSMLEYIQLLLLYIGSYVNFKRYRVKMIIIVCTILCIFIMNIVVTSIGFPLMMATNEFFIGAALLIILFFEFSSVAYFYGIANFCDDIEFMLDYLPSRYLRGTWYMLPVLFLFFGVASITLKFRKLKDEYEPAVLVCTVVLTVLPVLGFASYKCFVGIKKVGLRSLLHPRQSTSNWNDAEPNSVHRTL